MPLPKPKKGERVPGSGRKPGTPNGNTKTLIELCEKRGLNLFEAFLEIIQDENADPGLRFNALKEAAQYIYPKRKALEHSADAEKGFRIIVEDYRKK